MESLEHDTQETTHSEDASRHLNGISLLPAAATLGNLLCGFAAIVCALLTIRAGVAESPAFFARLEQLFPTYVVGGVYLIVLALVFDGLDGRLARLTRRTSEFGAQLDSLADMVSFGVAPAALAVALLLRPLADVDEQPGVAGASLRIAIAGVLVYVSCAAIRLARYNAENVHDEAGQETFSGLPAPGAALAVVAALAMLEQTGAQAHAAWALAATMLVAGLLMVSRLDYVHVFNVYVRRRRPVIHLVWLVFVVALGWYWFELLLVVLAGLYLLSGPANATWRRRATS